MKKKKKSNRNVIVFACLAGTLTLTSALLLALSPAPLTADASTSLFAVDVPQSLDTIFDTQSPAPPGRWKYIYVHQSQTLGGNATTLSGGVADHFIIGNGDGEVDGEIQISQQWAHQQSISTPPPGVERIDPACISICLVGNFDQSRPTPTQERRVAQLVQALQTRLRIPANHVWTIEQSGAAGGVGRLFPVAQFRSQILP